MARALKDKVDITSIELLEIGEQPSVDVLIS